MSNSTTLLDTISSSQASKEVTANALFDAESPAALYGRRASTTANLTWGYYGGYLNISGTNTAIANGTKTLTNTATNYIEADPTTGNVSVNTSAFTAANIPLYSAVVSGNLVTSYTDFRNSSVSLRAKDKIGTATSDTAAAGRVGEYSEANLPSANAISLSTGNAANVISLSLTAGDWDVSGVAAYHGDGTTSVSDVKQGISVSSGNFGTQGSFTYNYISAVVLSADDGNYTTPTVRVSLATTTTVYLVVMGDFSLSTLTAYGFIRARRIR